jgi:hypothetical protein
VQHSPTDCGDASFCGVFVRPVTEKAVEKRATSRPFARFNLLES